MKIFLQALIFSAALLCTSINANSTTIALSKTDTTKQIKRHKFKTDPTYKPFDRFVKWSLGIGSLGVLSFVVLLALGPYSIELGAALLIVAAFIGSLLTILAGLVVWLERFMTSVNRRRTKDGKPKVNWLLVRVIQISLLAIWYLRTNTTHKIGGG